MNDLKVFVNFRNGDGQHAAAHLYDALADRYRESQIFRSSNTIQPGDDYTEALAAAPADCEAMLALIGPRWLEIADARGKPRLSDPADWVRREIRTALEAERRVIPVLLDNARMPREFELPSDIAAVSRCQYRHWYSRDTRSSFNAIAERLESLVPGLVRNRKPESGNIQNNSPSHGGIVMAPMLGDNYNYWGRSPGQSD